MTDPTIDHELNPAPTQDSPVPGLEDRSEVEGENPANKAISEHWLLWGDRLLMLLLLSTHGAAVLDHLMNFVRANLRWWVPPAIILTAYGALWALYVRPLSGKVRPRLVWRLSLGAATLALLVMLVPARVTELSAEPLILISDVENNTDDPGFPVQVVKTTLTIGLKASPRISIFPDTKARDTLIRMQRLREEPITVEVARDICSREGIGLLLAAAVRNLNDKYIIDARIHDPKDGRVLYETTLAAFARDDITDAVNDLAKRLRKKFGESSLQINRTTMPLAPATSRSLPALEAYSKAVKYLGALKYDAAREQLRKALVLDPDFPLALVELASIYDQEGNVNVALAYSARAFMQSNRLTEPERVRVNDFYYWHVENDHERALRELTDFLERYPKNQDRLGSLAYENYMLMKFDVAEKANQKLLEKRPWGKSDEESAFSLWQTQLCLDKFAQSLETATQMRQDVPEPTFVPYLALIPRLGLGEIDVARQELAGFQSADPEAALWLGGLLDIYEGKLQAAFEKWTQYVQLIKKSERQIWVTNTDNAHLWLARIAVLEGNTEAAREQLKQVEEVHNEYLAEAGKYYAMIGDLNAAEAVLDRLRKRVVSETGQNRALLELLQGEIELHKDKGDPALSFALLSDAAKYQWLYLYLPLQDSLARAALKTGHYETAVDAYKNILERKKGFSIAWDRMDDWIMAHYGLGRSYEALGEKGLALSYYLEFEQLWQYGDKTLAAFVDAQERINELKR